MTRKHYTAIANAMRTNRPSLAVENDQLYFQWSQDILALASTLESLNPNFNRQLFINACTDA
jgi:hypothetical protein